MGIGELGRKNEILAIASRGVQQVALVKTSHLGEKS